MEEIFEEAIKKIYKIADCISEKAISRAAADAIEYTNSLYDLYFITSGEHKELLNRISQAEKDARFRSMAINRYITNDNKALFESTERRNNNED